MNEIDNRSKRWIRVCVDMFDHPALQSKEFDRRSAFAWLIANAAWKDHKVRMGNRMVEIKRGQVMVGLEHLSKEWGWGVKKVRLFLELLMSEGMLEKGTSKGRFANIATICNYEKYQTPPDQPGQVEWQVQGKLRAGSGQDSTKDTNIPNKNNYTSHLESARDSKQPEIAGLNGSTEYWVEAIALSFSQYAPNRDAAREILTGMSHEYGQEALFLAANDLRVDVEEGKAKANAKLLSRYCDTARRNLQSKDTDKTQTNEPKWVRENKQRLQKQQEIAAMICAEENMQ